MSLATVAQPDLQWTVEGFKAYWAAPDFTRLAAVRNIITDDIVGYWPRSIGTVRGPDRYMKVLGDIIAVAPDFALTVPEAASSGDFHFVRWIATGTGPDGRFEFTGCDRVRTRGGLVCENYIFCDNPFFDLVAAR